VDWKKFFLQGFNRHLEDRWSKKALLRSPTGIASVECRRYWGVGSTKDFIAITCKEGIGLTFGAPVPMKPIAFDESTLHSQQPHTLCVAS